MADMDQLKGQFPLTAFCKIDGQLYYRYDQESGLLELWTDPLQIARMNEEIEEARGPDGRVSVISIPDPFQSMIAFAGVREAKAIPHKITPEQLQLSDAPRRIIPINTQSREEISPPMNFFQRLLRLLWRREV